MAWNSSVWQLATIIGPSLGGAIYGSAITFSRVSIP